MQRTLLTAALLALLSILAGCQRDFYAKQIVQPDTGHGRRVLWLTGSAESLLEDGHIDAHKTVTVADGAELDVWVLKARQDDGSPAATPATASVLILHDVGDSKASYLSLGKRLARRGYDVILPDLRAHGRSGGKYVTWGAKEAPDLNAVVDALAIGKTVATDTVYVFGGGGMGGGIAIQYAALDPRVKGVMALTPFKDIGFTRRALMTVAPTMSGEDFQAVLVHAGRLADFDPADASTVNAAAKLRCPLLVVHGLLDLFVPLDNSEAVVEAAPEPKQLVVVPWASSVGLLIGQEDWIADQLHSIATTGLKKPVPEPEQSE